MGLTFLFITPLLRWILAALLLLVWGFIIRKLLRTESLSPARRNVKAGLNTLLFLLAGLFLFQPALPQHKREETLLVYDSSVPRQVTDSVKTAAKISQVISYKTFRKKFREYPHHRFFFLGQEAEPQLLSHLAGKEVEWIPYFVPETLQDIRWEGILKKGERQTVSGKISLSRPGILKLAYGEKILDSLSLEKGFNAFRMSFPVFSEGRTVLSLYLGGHPLRDIAFFARPARPLRITLLPDNPDFETRILAEWLGAQGHHVEVSTPVAQSVLYESRVNKASGKQLPDLVIASPSRAGDSRIKKAVSENRSVLFYALENVAESLSRINRATGTSFSARRTSMQENLPVKNGLTALPFELNDKPNQRKAGVWPVSFQKNGGRVAVSLMNETFPARLSGDTLTYSEIWGDIIAALDNSDSVKLSAEAPVFKDEPARITLMTEESAAVTGKDTLYLAASPVNPAKKSANSIFDSAGWKTPGTPGEIYVEDSPAASVTRLINWTGANYSLLRNDIPAADRHVPAGIWFWVLFLCLAALWVEAKFRY